MTVYLETFIYYYYYYYYGDMKMKTEKEIKDLAKFYRSEVDRLERKGYTNSDSWVRNSAVANVLEFIIEDA